MHIGVDMGGTKLEAVALDDAGRELLRRREPTPQGDYEATVRAIAGLVQGLESEAGKQGSVGVGFPGTISPQTGLAKNSNAVWVNGKPFDRDLSAALEREVRVANDANCFAVSEAIDGAAAGARVVFGVILGTGCGGGVAIEGRCHVGSNAVGGEWGHVPLPWTEADEKPGPPCYCGHRGCNEQWLAGRGLERAYDTATGEHRKAPEIVALADAGDGPAEAALSRYEDRLARALAALVTVLDPDVIVLGGGLSNVARLYERVPDLMAKWVFGRECATPIRRALHGDSSGVRGAAWLWPGDRKGETAWR
jgi:fructokinase